MTKKFSKAQEGSEITFFKCFYFNLYIYPPDSQKSDGGANI